MAFPINLESFAVLTVVMLSGWSHVAAGDEPDCPPIEVRESPYLHEIWDGSVNPEKIPDHLKYRSFELRYNDYLTELVQRLTPSDHAIIMNAKSESDYWRNVDGERYTQQFIELCASSAGMDAVAIATEYERLALESNNLSANRMRNAIESLSPIGREAVLDYIENEITPRKTYPKTNSVTLASDDPDSFVGSFAVMCYVSTHGEPPPEIKKVMECHQQRQESDPQRNNQPAVGLFPRSQN